MPEDDVTSGLSSASGILPRFWMRYSHSLVKENFGGFFSTKVMKPKAKSAMMKSK